jgi:agmatine deiminase
VNRIPAEWVPHERTVICWPARPSIYKELMGDAEAAHALVGSTIARFEPVTMIADVGSGARAAEACGAGVDVVELPINDSWFRDSGPIYVLDSERGTRTALDWAFNAWGGKIHPFDDDAAVARRYAELAGDDTRTIGMVLEGGSIAVDGQGTLVTTEQCLLHPNRNPSLTRTEIEATLRDELGVTTIVWLPFGLALDDDTDGHVDNVAAFARPGTLLVQGCDDEAEEDWLRCHVNARCARGAIDARGDAIDVVDVPVLPFTEIGGQRVAVPYLNFYVANGVVVVPVCSHPADDDMLAIIAGQFPDREVIGLDVGAVLACGGGGIHCITQQVPRMPTAGQPAV